MKVYQPNSERFVCVRVQYCSLQPATSLPPCPSPSKPQRGAIMTADYLETFRFTAGYCHIYLFVFPLLTVGAVCRGRAVNHDPYKNGPAVDVVGRVGVHVGDLEARPTQVQITGH